MTHKKLAILLKRLRDELHMLLGNQLAAIYLYGSQARGNARSDSDIDVLVILQGDFDYFGMIERTGDLVSKLSLEYETVISLAFISQVVFENRMSPFLLNIRQEGVLV